MNVLSALWKMQCSNERLFRIYCCTKTCEYKFLSSKSRKTRQTYLIWLIFNDLKVYTQSSLESIIVSPLSTTPVTFCFFACNIWLSLTLVTCRKWRDHFEYFLRNVGFYIEFLWIERHEKLMKQTASRGKDDNIVYRNIVHRKQLHCYMGRSKTVTSYLTLYFLSNRGIIKKQLNLCWEPVLGT